MNHVNRYDRVTLLTMGMAIGWLNIAMAMYFEFPSWGNPTWDLPAFAGAVCLVVAVLLLFARPKE